MVTSLDRWTEIFDHDGGDYSFVMSHTALSGNGVRQTFEGGQWVLTQYANTTTYVVRHEDHTAAVLLLIAMRLGLVGHLRREE